MSNFCCINLKNNAVCTNYKDYNALAKELINYALNHNMAVFFNSFDYGIDIIKSAHMHDFIIISDSFLYKNCELLDNTEFITLIESNEFSEYRNQFYKKYKFLEDIINIIFKYDVYTIELFISEDGSVDNEAEFLCMTSTKKSLLSNLFDCVINSTNEYGNEFPSLKVIIDKV